MKQVARGIVVLLAALSSVPAAAHGGRFRGPPQGGVPPGLPAQPTAPARTGKVPHDWLVWWGYNQQFYVDFRRRQRDRRGAITPSEKGVAAPQPDAWRDELRGKLTPLMIEALGDEDKEVRTAAAVALGKFGARNAIPALQKLVETDTVQEVREAALQGLLLMGTAQLRDYFVTLAETQGEKPRLRGFALMALGRMDDANARQYLLDFFDKKRGRTQRAKMPKSTGERREFLIAALAGLAISGDKTLAESLLAIARDRRQDEDVRAYALSAMAKLEPDGMLDAVLEVLGREPNDQVRRSAAVAVGLLAPRENEDAVAALVRAIVKDSDKIVQHFAILSLGQVGGQHAFEELARRQSRADRESLGFFQLALGLSGNPDAAPLLAKTLNGAANANDRGAAAIGFALLGDRTQAPVVRDQFAHAKSWILLQTTVLCLGMLNDRPSIEPVKEVLETRKQPELRMAAALAYALLAQHDAVRTFSNLLARSDSILMLTALTRVMALLASPKAAEALEALYADKKLQRQVRAYALVGLGTIADRTDHPLFAWLGYHVNYFVRCDPLDEVLTIL